MRHEICLVTSIRLSSSCWNRMIKTPRSSKTFVVGSYRVKWRSKHGILLRNVTLERNVSGCLLWQGHGSAGGWCERRCIKIRECESEARTLMLSYGKCAATLPLFTLDSFMAIYHQASHYATGHIHLLSSFEELIASTCILINRIR